MDWQDIRDLLHTELFSLGGQRVTPAEILQFGVLVVIVFVASGWTRRLMRDRLLRRTHLDEGGRDAFARITSYVVFVLGMLVVLETLGFKLSSLAVIGGALGVGIGFGLQNVVSNFVSGIIILFERPITVGQRVEVGGTTGEVTRIGARSTTVVTNDNIAYIIPNSEFVMHQVINWSYGGDSRVRISIPVGVAYGSDPRRVEKLLLEVAKHQANVLQDRAPDVIFKGFGESSLDFELRVWTDTHAGQPNVLRSQLNFAIWDAFDAAGIEIPFPQRDLRLHGPVQVELAPGAPGASGTSERRAQPASDGRAGE